MKASRELEQIGGKIWSLSRTELYLEMPFLGAALDSLEIYMDRSVRTVGTDAFSIRYQPVWLTQEYLAHPYRINRVYLHMLLHCVFRHMFSADRFADGELWDLCCDIAVESVMDSFDYEAVAVTPSDFREEWYDRLKSEVRVLTAERIYRYFLSLKEDYELRMRLIREFSQDEHSLWKRMEESPDPGGGAGQSRDSSPAPDAQRSNDPGQPDREERTDPGDEQDNNRGRPEDTQNPSSAVRGNTLPMGSIKQKDEEWRKHAKRIRSDLETYAKDAAEDRGSLIWMLRVSTEIRRDYRDFLKQFSVIREEAHIDPDSFDYAYYHFGMEHYGNMPLIEENEYREAKKVETLVIAVDTSASCKERLVQRFLNETAAILSRQESFFHRIHVRIIECDDQIQREEIITEPGQIRRYSEGFRMQGGYGTDFRPVFAHVARLQKEGKLKNLKGLMYFTDGFGEYPSRPTPYQTAFVFSDAEENNAAKAPPWALKLFIS